MKTFLVILFVIGGELSVVEGWLPREQESQMICNRHADYARDHIATLENFPIAMVGCVRAKDPAIAAAKLKQKGLPL